MAENKQTVKVNYLKRFKQVSGLVFVVGFFIASFTPSVSAETFGGGSVQAYAADKPLQNGTIVVLTGKDANRVKIASIANVQNMFGVVVDRNLLPLAITNEAIQNETFVAVSGTYNVLVSNQEGIIAAGDYLTLSSIDGVAMQASTDEVTVFGRANASFDGKTSTLGSSTLKDSSGNEKTVTIGLIPVTIDIKNNPNHKSTDTNVPEFLKRVGQAIAEKPVSEVRLYIGVGIATVSLITAIAVLYAGVRNSIISIGRNPMSKKSIFRALIEVILTSALILIIGLFAVYLLLKL